MEKPKNFFRFRNWPQTSPNYTRSLLEEAAFYCSGPRDFDDPHDSHLGAHATGDSRDIDRWISLDMEGLPVLLRKYNLSSITQLSEETITDPSDRAVLSAIAGRSARRDTRVVCFSGDFASELMWAFYADNHRGICLGFNSEDSFFAHAEPVMYDQSPPAKNSDVSPHNDRLTYHKSVAWKFQEEWRLVYHGAESPKVFFPKESLTMVILGYRFPAVQYQDLKSLLSNGNYCVDVLRVQRIPGSYVLGLEMIEKIVPARQS